MGKNLIIVDVQPEYAKFSEHMHQALVSYTKKYRFDNTIIFFNDGEYYMWDDNEITMREHYLNLGFSKIFIQKSHFIPKQYHFFRSWMDYGVSHDQIVYVVKYMLNNGIFDSSDIENWGEVYDGTDYIEEDHPEFDSINIPVWDYKILERYDNYILTGGQFAACLAEIRILLEALDKKYEVNYDLIY
jgi:hypothetical protein